MPSGASQTPQRTHYDWLIKAVLRRFGADLAAWLLEERPVEAVSISTSLPAVSLVDADRVLSVKFRAGPSLLLHVEFQMEGDPKMPVRMAEYLVRIRRLLENPEHCGKRLASAVVYLDPRTYRSEDPGVLDVEGDLGTRLFVSYRVVKLWEKDPGPILAMESPGLCPFVPLMRGNPVELAIESKEKILRVPEEVAPFEAKRELLVVLGILASRAIKDRGFLGRLLSEVRKMGENYWIDVLLEEGMEKGLEKGREKGREEGREEGRREEALRAIRRVLTRRFGEVREDVSTRLEAIVELGDLEGLLEEAAIATSLDAFCARLPPASTR